MCVFLLIHITSTHTKAPTPTQKTHQTLSLYAQFCILNKRENVSERLADLEKVRSCRCDLKEKLESSSLRDDLVDINDSLRVAV